MFGKGVTAHDAQVIRDVLLCERMGWTLDYLRSLDPLDYAAVVGVLDGYDHGVRWQQRHPPKG